MTTPSNEVLETNIKYMQEDIKDIKKTLKNFIVDVRKSFASKEELKRVEDKANENDKFIKKVMWTAVVSLIWFLIQIARTTLIK